MGFIPMDMAKKGEGADLSGNASVYDVLEPKTFYNTDPEVKLTGAMKTYKTGELTVSTGLTNVSNLPVDFIYGSAVVYNGEIHILGGYNSNKSHYKWNGTSWISVSTLPYQFYYGSAVVYNGEIHILGSGYSSTYYTNHYKWNGEEWLPASTLPYRFYRGAAVVYNGEIHILGGAYDDTAHCKWNGSTWTTLSSISRSFNNGAAVVYNNQIHLFDEYYHIIYTSNGSYTTSKFDKGIIPINMNGGNAIVYNNEIHLFKNSHYIWDGIYREWKQTNIDSNSYITELTTVYPVIYNNEIHILGYMQGGTMSISYSYRHYKYPVLSGSTLPYRFYYGDAVVYNNEIHILGGNGDYTKHYKWDGTSWTNVSTLPYNFYYAPAVVYDNKIHILGTYAGGNETKHYAWNGFSWTQVSTLPYYVDKGRAVVYNNEIHVMGGENSSYHKYHYKWNGSTWSSVSTLPYDFYFGSAVVYNNEIHILGSNSSSAYTKHYKWDGSTWTSVSALPYIFYLGSAVVYNNEIHIMGSAYNGNYYKCHYKWDGSSWSEVSALPYDFYRGSAVVYNDCINILGGSGNSTNHSILDFIVSNHEIYKKYILCDEEFYIDGYSEDLCLTNKTLAEQTPGNAIGDDILSSETAWVNGQQYTGSLSNYNKFLNKDLTNINNTFAISTMEFSNNNKHITSIDDAIDYAGYLDYNSYGSSFISYNNIIYKIGGNDCQTRISSINPKTLVETVGVTIPMPFLHGTALNNTTNLYILSSYASGYESLVYRTTTAMASWATVPSLPAQPSSFSTSVFYSSKFYLFGESSKCYSGPGNSWTALSNVPANFDCGVAVVCSGKIYIVGGSSSSQNLYSFNGTTWTRLANCPVYVDRSYNYDSCAVVSYRDNIHVFSRDGHYSYNPVTNYWTLLDDTAYISSFMTMPYYGVICNGSIYIFDKYNNVAVYNNDYIHKGIVIESSGDINTSYDSYMYQLRDKIRCPEYNQSTIKDMAGYKIHIPKGCVYWLCINSYQKSTGAYKGSNEYIIYTNGGTSSTTAQAVPKYTTFGANGGGGATLSVGVSTVYSDRIVNDPQTAKDGYIPKYVSGSVSYAGHFIIGATTTDFCVNYSLMPLLTPVQSSFCDAFQ